MAFAKRTAGIAIVIAVALTGCAQPDPNASPTYACTPSDGETARPCYKAEYDQQVKEDQLYAEAESVYRKYLAEHERIYRAGGTRELTPTMKAVLTGKALDQALTTYREMATDSTRAIGGEFKIGYFHRVPGEVIGESVATIESCIDATTVTFKEPNLTQQGNVSLERAYFSRIDSGIKISHFKTYTGEVEKCE